MPIYEFECDKCKKQFEVVTLSLSEKPNAVCPKCKSKKHTNWYPKSAKANTGLFVQAVQLQQARRQVQRVHPVPLLTVHPAVIKRSVI